MKAQILSIITTIQIDQYQVDISYNFSSREIEIFVDANLHLRWHFNPERMIYNHMNMIEIAATAVTRWKKKRNDLWDDPFQDY